MRGVAKAKEVQRLRRSGGSAGGQAVPTGSTAQQGRGLTKEEATALQQLWPWQRVSDSRGVQISSRVAHAAEPRPAAGAETERRRTPMLTQAMCVDMLGSKVLGSDGKAAAVLRGQQLRDVATAGSVHDDGDGAQAHVQAIEAAFTDFGAEDRLQLAVQGQAGLGVTARRDMPHRKARPRTLLRGVAVHDFPQACDPDSRYMPCAQEQAAGLEASLCGPIAFVNTACSAAHANIRFKMHARDGALKVSAQQTAPIKAGDALLAAYDLRFTGGACVRCNKEIERKSDGQGSIGAGGQLPTRARKLYKTAGGRIYWVCGVTGATEWLLVPHEGRDEA